MGMDYCLIFDNEDAEHAFASLRFFPLIIDKLDKLAAFKSIEPFGKFLHHDPESDPPEMFALDAGINSLKAVIACVEEAAPKKYESFSSEEILEELVFLRDALQDNLKSNASFVVALLY